jgi:hypothetical protein
MAEKKSQSSQTAVDSFFSYLYYSPQTEMSATAQDMRDTEQGMLVTMTPGFEIV